MAVVDTSQLTSWLNQVGQTITYGVTNAVNNLGYWINQSNQQTRDALGNQINANFSYLNNTTNNIYSLISQQNSNAVNLFNQIANRISQPTSFDPNVALNAINNVSVNMQNQINGITNTINNSINSYANGTQNSFNTAINTVSQLIRNVENTINSRLTDPNTNLQAIINNVLGPIPGVITSIVSTLSNTYQQVVQSQKTDVNGALVNITNAIREANGAASAGLREGINGATQVYNTATRSMADQFENFVNGALELLKVPDILNLPDDFRSDISDITQSLKRAFPDDKDKPALEAEQIPILGDIIRMIRDVIQRWFGITFGLAKGEVKNFNQLGGVVGEGQLAGLSTGEIFSALMSLFPLASRLLFAVSEPANRRLTQLINKEFTPELLDLTMYADLFNNGRISQEIYEDMAKRHGLNVDDAVKFAVLTKKFIPINNLFTAFNTHMFDENKLREYLHRMGYDNEQIMAFIPTLYNPLTPRDYIASWLRGDQIDETLTSNLERLNLDKEDITLLKKLAFFIPPVQDLIRMAVREVFTPEIAEKFGQFEDYPKTFTEQARKQGISEEWAKRYWAAHWDLPSLSAGYEMLHRGVISKSELELLLRAQDVMPYWRDKLVQISYNPLTRVDVRRMYRLGVLTRDDVKKNYLDLGYSPENAELMTEFTIRYESEPEGTSQEKIRELTQATILKAYANNIIDYNDAFNRLLQIGYYDDDANLLLRIKDFDKSSGVIESVDANFADRGIKLVKDMYLRKVYGEQEAINAFMALGYSANQASLEVQFLSQEYDRKLKDKAIDIVRTAYMERTFDRNFTIAMLNAFSVDGQEQQELLAELDAFKDLRADKLQYSQLRALFRQGIISELEYLEELRGLGYAEKYVIWLARSEGIKI